MSIKQEKTTKWVAFGNCRLVDCCIGLCGIICIFILYGVIHFYNYVASLDHMSIAFVALRGIVEQIPERLVTLNKNGDYSGRIVVDLSWDREFSLISKLLQKRTPKPRDFEDFVVDLGAFDGKISSNSYNFFQAGWSGLLVEANSGSMQLTKDHTRQFLDLGQRLSYEQVAVINHPLKPDEPKTIRLVQYANPTENALETLVRKSEIESARVKGAETWTFVDKVDIMTLFKRNKVPLKFGLLSIDIEGGDATGMVCTVIANNYEPEYIIVEAGSTPPCFRKSDAPYEFVTKRRYNRIWRKKRPGI